VGDGESHRRRASRRTVVREQSGFWAPGVHGRGRGARQLRTTMGKLLVALDWRGRAWLRRIAPELGGSRTGRRRRGKPLLVDCWLRESYGGGLGLSECSAELGVPFYSATGLAPRRWIRSTTSRRCCSCRASWRRRARADEHVDKHGLFPGGSWRARVAWAAPSTAEPAADAGVPPRELCRRRCRAPVRLGGLLRGGECMARLCRRAGTSDGTRRLECTHVQNARSGRGQSTHATFSSKCQRVLESSNDAGSKQV